MRKGLKAVYGGEPVYPVAPLGEALLKWRGTDMLDYEGNNQGDRAEGRWTPLAELAGISARNIRRYTMAETPGVTRDVADRLCIAMGIHLNEVYPFDPYDAARLWFRIINEEIDVLPDSAALSVVLLGNELERLG